MTPQFTGLMPTPQEVRTAIRDGVRLAFRDLLADAFDGSTADTQFLAAVQEGVAGAFVAMIRNGTDMPTADILESIKAGVKEAFADRDVPPAS